MQTHYIKPSDEAAKQLFSQPMNEEVIMVNLLRFRDIADYSAFPELAPDEHISGKAAYQLYIEQTMPFLKASGGELMLLGESQHFFIGPEDESWDMVMIVKQKSLASFLSFASDPECMKVTGHREAALLDSRLLPVKPLITEK